MVGDHISSPIGINVPVDIYLDYNRNSPPRGGNDF